MNSSSNDQKSQATFLASFFILLIVLAVVAGLLNMITGWTERKLLHWQQPT